MTIFRFIFVSVVACLCLYLITLAVLSDSENAKAQAQAEPQITTNGMVARGREYELSEFDYKGHHYLMVQGRHNLHFSVALCEEIKP